MQDITPPSYLNKYSTASATGQCQFVYSLVFTQIINEGPITVPITSPIQLASLNYKSTNNIQSFYDISVDVPIGESQFFVGATSGAVTKQFLISYTCEAPPTTLDITFFNDTLYDSYGPSTDGPILTFKVNNFLKTGPALSATSSSQSLIVDQNSLILLSDNLYGLALKFSDGTKWTDIENDFTISIEYKGSTFALPSNHLIKSNIKINNQIQIGSYTLYSLNPLNSTKSYHLYPYIEYQSSLDEHPLWVMTSSVNAFNSRLSLSMGSFSNGLITSVLYKGGVTTTSISLSNNNNPVPIISKPVTFQPPPSTDTVYSSSTDLTNGILSSILSTNMPIKQCLILSGLPTPYFYYSDSFYPYGITQGTSLSHIRQDEFFVSPLKKGIVYVSYPLTMNSYELIPSIYDDSPPNIESIETFYIGSILIYRVHITDDSSGFFQIDKIGNYTSLVSGTIQDGIYEFQLNIAEVFFPTTVLLIYDKALNCKVVDMTTFQTAGKHSFKPNEFNSVLDINRVYWKYNDVDVSGQAVDNILYICSNVTTLKPHILPYNQATTLIWYRPVLGIYNSSIGCYEYEYPIHKNFIPGSYDSYIWLGSLWRSINFLIPMFGEESKLRVRSTFGDALGPLIGSITLLPSGSVLIQSDTEIKWKLTISDPINGFKTGIVSIVSQVGWVRYNFTLSPTVEGHMVSGDQYMGFYEISIPINSICTSQKFSIYFIQLEDQNGWISEHPTTNIFYINPLMKYIDDIDATTSISIDCPSSTDISAPTLSSFDFSPKWIDPTYSGELFSNTPRMVHFQFQVSDNVGILKEALPVIYLSDQNFNRISQISELVTYSTTYATYECKFNIPFGYGYPEGIKVSLFGLVDFNNNIGGYTIASLNSTFPNTIEVSNTFSPKISILSTLPLYSDRDFYVMGTNFQSTDVLMIQDERLDIISNISSISSMKTISKFTMGALQGDFVFITFRREVSNGVYEYSNSFKVKIMGTSTDSSSLSSSSSSSNSKSSSVPASSSDSSPETIPPTNAPQQCIDQCSGNGECTLNGCICKSPWVGLDCSSKVIIIDPSINSTIPVTNVTIPPTNNGESVLYAIISILSLNELNNNGDIINSYPFTKWVASNNTNSKYSEYTSLSYLYTTTVTNKYDQSTTTLNVSIDYFDKDAVNITFANQILTMNPYSLKYSVNISQYSFSSSLNTLQVVLSASIESEKDDNECSSIQTGNTVESESEFIKIQVNDHSLYGRFIKRGIVDGRIRQITNTPLNTYSKSTPSKSQTLIGINVPHYQKMIQLDPDFSVLLDNRAATIDSPNAVCFEKKSKLTGAQIAGIVIGSFALVAIVVVCIVYYLYKRKQKAIFMKNIDQKLGQINNKG
ncbi:hypothetical protein CYY_003941 [Polysphondylium violaceum]|uniref:EGF-like domain-containing protein n=1 Tax=Polysphondylium violaceum TaxID=133409 RepID=A0A8J4PVE4_9MYCE|nr:hypothetical protein CYY_003941 [Polysphondylium violaceum]